MSLEIKISSTGKYLNVNSLGKNTNRQMIPKNLPETNRKVQNVLVRMKKDLAEMIKADIENNIKRGVKYTGGKVADLKKSTYERKGFRRPLFETGQLLKGVKMKKSGKNYIISMSDTKYRKRYKGQKSTPTIAEVAGYLQSGNSNMRARPFFGMTKSKSELFFNKMSNKYGRVLRDIIVKDFKNPQTVGNMRVF
mgnify:FL=1